MQVLGVIPTCTPNCATDLILRSRVAFVLAEEAGGVELSVGVAGGGGGPEAVVDAPRVSRDAISIDVALDQLSWSLKNVCNRLL